MNLKLTHRQTQSIETAAESKESACYVSEHQQKGTGHNEAICITCIIYYSVRVTLRKRPIDRKRKTT